MVLEAVHSLDVSALIDGLAEVRVDREPLEGPVNDFTCVSVGSRSVLSRWCERGWAQAGVLEGDLRLNLLLVSSGTRIIRKFGLQRVLLGQAVEGVVVRLDREAVDEGGVLEDLRAGQRDTLVLGGDGELATLSRVEREVLHLDGKVVVLGDEVHISGGDRVHLVVESRCLDRNVYRVNARVLDRDWHLNWRLLAAAVVVTRLLIDGHVDGARLRALVAVGVRWTNVVSRTDGDNVAVILTIDNIASSAAVSGRIKGLSKVTEDWIDTEFGLQGLALLGVGDSVDHRGWSRGNNNGVHTRVLNRELHLERLAVVGVELVADLVGEDVIARRHILVGPIIRCERPRSLAIRVELLAGQCVGRTDSLALNRGLAIAGIYIEVSIGEGHVITRVLVHSKIIILGGGGNGHSVEPARGQSVHIEVFSGNLLRILGSIDGV